MRAEMKTLLLVGGALLLLLGLILLAAALVVFLVARNRAAKSGPAFVPVQPMTAPPPPPPPPPPVYEQAAVPDAPVVAVAPPAPEPNFDTDATVLAGSTGLGALHAVSGALAGQTFPLKMDGFYIGRDRTLSQVVIEDASVSKRHVWVGVREGVVTAVDQSSTNGTYLNTLGTRIGQVRLTPGDTLILSDDVARFEYKA